MTKRHKLDMAAGILRLAEAFPKTFFLYAAQRKPLKVGIHDDIRAALGDAMGEDELSGVMRYYCGNEVYMKRCVAGAARIDLDGSPAGEVTAAEAEHAAKLLQRRASKRAALEAAPKPPPSSTPSLASAPKPAPPEAPSPAPALPKRLGLSDLKAAWAQRKAS